MTIKYTENGATHIITISNEKDAEMFQDYLENGLKLIRIENGMYYFNDFARLTDVTMPGQAKTYILHKDGSTYNNARYTKKYIKLI